MTDQTTAAVPDDLKTVFSTLFAKLPEGSTVNLRDPDHAPIPVKVGSAKTLETALAIEPEPYVDNTSGDLVPFLYEYAPDVTAFEWQTCVKQPTLVLVKTEEERHHEMRFYVFDTPQTREDVSALAAAMDCDLAVAAPLPGSVGWKVAQFVAQAAVEEDRRGKTFSLDALEALFEVGGAVVATPAATTALPVFAEIEDAKVLTAGFSLDDARYAKPITISTGRLRKPRPGQKRSDNATWVRKDTTPAAFIKELAEHKPSRDKEGTAFVLAELAGNARNKASVTKCYGIGLDVDVGTPGSVIDQAMIDFGYLGLRYTTHSHGKTVSRIKKDTITGWLAKRDVDVVDLDGIVRYLREEKRWDDSVLDSMIYDGDAHVSPEGLVVVLNHPPLQKHRIVYLLDEPLEPAKVRKTHKEGMDLVGDLCRGLGRALGDLPIDTSAVDPSRLFFNPRHVEGQPYETTIVGGDLLPWGAIPLGAADDNYPTSDDPAIQALLDEVKACEKTKAKSSTPEGLALGRWSIGKAARFQIVDAIRDHCAERIRTNGSEVIDIECPFDAHHTETDNPEDTACFAVNAGEGDGTPLFVVKCMHDSCKDKRTNLDHLGKMISDGWLPEDVKDDPYYLAEEDENAASPQAAKIIAEDAARAVYESLVEGLSPDSTAAEIDACLIAVVEAGLPTTEFMLVEGKIKKALKVPQAQITKSIRAAQAVVAQARKEAAKVDPDYPLPAFMPTTRVLKRGTRLYLHRANDGPGGDEPLCTRFAIVGGGIYADREGSRDVEVVIENEFGKREAVRLDAEGLGVKNKVIGLLRKKGMTFASEEGETFAHRALMDYQPSNTVIRDRCGWLENGDFLLPTGVYLGDGQDVRLSDERRIQAPPTKGTLEGWKAAAAVACASHSPSLHAGLLAGFAGPLTGLTGQATLVLAFTGVSTEGKTWRQKCGVAVSGPPQPGVGQMKSMNSTEGALEVPLERGSCTIAAFDELHHAPAKVVQNLVFRASGEQGRARLGQQGQRGITREWKGGVVTLSTETGLAQRLRQEGENLAGGATVRMIEVDVTTGRLGSEEWEKANAMLGNYGWALPEFINEVRAQGYVEDPAALNKRVQGFIATLEGVDTPMALRAATAVGYLCVAGEIAKEAGLLPETFDIDAVGATLWEGALGGDLKAEDPVDRAIDMLLETVNTRRADIFDDMTNDRPFHRETMGWVSDHGGEKVYCIRASILGKWSGGAADERALKKALIERGIAIPNTRQKSRNGKIVVSNGAVWDKWKAPVGGTKVIALKASAIDGVEDLVPKP